MPFTIQDDDDLPFILVTMSGVLDDAELPVYQDAAYASPGFRTKDHLVDLTNVTSLEITANGVRSFASRALKRVEVLEARVGRKIAILAPDDLGFGLTRLFLAHVEEMAAEHRVFRSEHEARQWLDPRDSLL